MRILTVGNMYPPHHLGGYELVWRSAVEHLRARGHELVVLTSDHREADPDPSFEDGPFVRRELRWYWHEHEFPRLGVRERLRLERHNAAVFDGIVEQLRPDVVAWWAMGGMSLSLLERARRRGLPALAVVHDDWPAYGPRVDAWTRLARRLPGLGRLAGVPVPRRLGGVARWSFNSAAQRARVSGAVGAGSVDHPGIDLELFRAAEPAGWSWRLLYCGRLDRRKGVDLAVEALAQLPADATLAIVGEGEDAYAGELRTLAQRIAPGRVELGRQARERLPAAYAAADAVVFPVRWHEPWGLVPLEAMAVGRPVVASGRGGSAEYLCDGDNCLLFDPNEGPDALAAALRWLAEDPALRERLRAGGHTTAARFGEQAFNERIERLLGELAGAAG